MSHGLRGDGPATVLARLTAFGTTGGKEGGKRPLDVCRGQTCENDPAEGRGQPESDMLLADQPRRWPDTCPVALDPRFEELPYGERPPGRCDCAKTQITAESVQPIPRFLRSPATDNAALRCAVRLGPREGATPAATIG
jgi:hypothetical protein